jgi:deoxyxylulose-5-phosphate synthase
MSKIQENAVSIEVLKGLFVKKFDDALYSVQLREKLLNVATNENNAKKSNVKKALKELLKAREHFYTVQKILNEVEMELGIK